MIALKTFAAAIQAGLNSNGDIAFRIFVDAGEYEKAKKTRTQKQKYTNGLLRVGTSSIVPTQGAVIATQGVQLEIAVQLPRPETDEEIISAHRAVLDTYFQNFSTQLITDDNGKKYSVAAVYSLASTGTVEQREGIGTSLTFFVNINYSYVENGINSADCVFTLDGNVIPFMSAGIVKNPTTEVNAYAAVTGKGEGVNTSFVRRFNFEMPALTDNAISTALLAAVLDNTLNEKHTLVVTIGDSASKTYTVIIGDVELNVQGVNNLGHKFSLIETTSFTEESNG